MELPRPSIPSVPPLTLRRNCQCLPQIVESSSDEVQAPRYKHMRLPGVRAQLPRRVQGARYIRFKADVRVPLMPSPDVDKLALCRFRYHGGFTRRWMEREMMVSSCLCLGSSRLPTCAGAELRVRVVAGKDDVLDGAVLERTGQALEDLCRVSLV